MRQLLFAISLASLFGAATSVSSQPIIARGGEHADFSRVVLTIPENANWSISGAERHYQVNFENTREFNLSELFARIPRNRLVSANVSPSGQSLELELGCNCTVNAWQEQSRLIVIDIVDFASGSNRITDTNQAGEQLVREPSSHNESAAQPGSNSVSIETARSIGEALAMRLQASLPARATNQLPAQTPEVPTLEALALPFARALGQGLLEPDSASLSETQSLLLSGQNTASTPVANMLVSNALGEVSQTAPPLSNASPNCDGASEVEAMLVAHDTPFNTAMGTTSLDLFGEFDQPNPQAHYDLLQLYLASGFGAEARVLIENTPEPIPGRDFLLGLSDVLEERNSNSRLRLSQAISCGGATSVLAALAGAPETAIEQQATDIVLAFSRFPPPLQSALGPQLIRILLDANAIDAARIVAEGLRRSSWVSADTMLLIDTRLDRGRGLEEEALSRMLFYDANDLASFQEQLGISLEHNMALSPETIADVEASASAFKHTAEGQMLMATLIEVLASTGEFGRGFEALDRLETWLAPQQLRERFLGPLHQLLWQELTSNSSDLTFVTEVLRRNDWQADALPQTTREAMANRLASLGLENAIELLALSQPNSVGSNGQEDGLQTAQRHLDAAHPRRGSRPQMTDLTSNAPSPQEATVRMPAATQNENRDTVAQTPVAPRRSPPASSEAHVRTTAPESLHAAEAGPLSVRTQNNSVEREQTAAQPIAPQANANDDPTPDLGLNAAPPEIVSTPPAQLSSSGEIHTIDRRGLLAQGSDLITQSAHLRARLEALLTPD